MLVEAGLFIALGLAAALLPGVTAYRRRAAQRLADRAGVAVPPEQLPALEARVARRSRAAAVGMVLAGVALAVLDRVVGEEQLVQVGAGWVAMALLFGFAVAALAVVEIWRPGTVPDDGARTARAVAPRLGDYLPRLVVVLTWVFTAVGVLALALTWGLGGSRWFDAATVRTGAVPALLVALPLLAGLTVLAVRRVLDAPQPARDETELFWQDAVRANTLSALHVPLAVVGLFATALSARTLDAAASTVAEATGQLAPVWTTALMVGGYALPLVLLAVALVLTLGPWGGTEVTHVRQRLWGGRTPGQGHPATVAS